MKRWASNLFCLFSLLVLLSSVTIWVRSYFTGEYIAWTYDPSHITANPPRTRYLGYLFFWEDGIIGFYRKRADVSGPLGWQLGWEYHRYLVHQTLVPSIHRRDGTNVHFGDFHFFYLHVADSAGWFTDREITIPLWLFLPAAIPPIIWWRRRRQRSGRGFPVTISSTSEPGLGKEDQGV